MILTRRALVTILSFVITLLIFNKKQQAGRSWSKGTAGTKNNYYGRIRRHMMQSAENMEAVTLSPTPFTDDANSTTGTFRLAANQPKGGYERFGATPFWIALGVQIIVLVMDVGKFLYDLKSGEEKVGKSCCWTFLGIAFTTLGLALLDKIAYDSFVGSNLYIWDSLHPDSNSTEFSVLASTAEAAAGETCYRFQHQEITDYCLVELQDMKKCIIEDNRRETCDLGLGCRQFLNTDIYDCDSDDDRIACVEKTIKELEDNPPHLVVNFMDKILLGWIPVGAYLAGNFARLVFTIFNWYGWKRLFKTDVKCGRRKQAKDGSTPDESLVSHGEEEETCILPTTSSSRKERFDSSQGVEESDEKPKAYKNNNGDTDMKPGAEEEELPSKEETDKEEQEARRQAEEDSHRASDEEAILKNEEEAKNQAEEEEEEHRSEELLDWIAGALQDGFCYGTMMFILQISFSNDCLQLSYLTNVNFFTGFYFGVCSYFYVFSVFAITFIFLSWCLVQHCSDNCDDCIGMISLLTCWAVFMFCGTAFVSFVYSMIIAVQMAVEDSEATAILSVVFMILSVCIVPGYTTFCVSK